MKLTNHSRHQMLNKNHLTFCLLLILLSSCFYYENKFMLEDVFDKIDNCKAEYERYHPNAHNKKFRSKTCSRVKNRMCIINKYCKGDLQCSAEAKRAYPPYGVIEDKAYCLSLVETAKESKKD